MSQPVRIHIRRLRRRDRELLPTKLKGKTLSARIYERYRVIAEGVAGRSVPDTADRVGVHFTTVYDRVHRFNEEGLVRF